MDTVSLPASRRAPARRVSMLKPCSRVAGVRARTRSGKVNVKPGRILYADVVASEPRCTGAAWCEGRARRRVGTGTGPGHGRPPQASYDRRHRGI